MKFTAPPPQNKIKINVISSNRYHSCPVYYGYSSKVLLLIDKRIASFFDTVYPQKESFSIKKSMKNLLALFLALLVFAIQGCVQQSNESNSPKRPNILLIVADDMAYSDLGTFGSEISTPNIDALAFEGTTFTQFYSLPSCAPTRASLLTGTNNHVAGVGSQFNRTGNIWGYEGFLTDRVLTIPQVLSQNGYQNYMVGKWHLGMKQDQLADAKGFQKSFILHQGAANHYNNEGFEATDKPSIYSLNGKVVDWPDGQYSTDTYTDFLIDFINQGSAVDEPFFAFAAYTSPHWPLQVDSEYWEKYEEIYKDGYEVLRSQRLSALKEKGIIAKDYPLPELHSSVAAWDTLSAEQKKIEIRKMALYAGMMENLDNNVGRLVGHLKNIGEYENTIIVFMSDNGAAFRDFYEVGPFKEFLQTNYDNSYENMGKASSFVSYGTAWAEAGSAPFKYFKQYTYEGGIRVPMIIRDPKAMVKGNIKTGLLTLTDLAPTFYQLAGVEYPNEHKGQNIYPLQGKSMLALLREDTEVIHSHTDTWIAEHHRQVLVRKGDWKLINAGQTLDESQFQLYNIVKDPVENIDLKTMNPVKYNELLAHWRKFKEDNQIKEKPGGKE
ncbi:MAG: arylsulfatase A-like enzyme [Paraglaciecola sp.]